MSKEFFVLRGGRVVYTPGHYSRDGAIATARRESYLHPHSVVHVVMITDSYAGPLYKEIRT